ncbi:MAG: Tyrosine-tRNA ligase [uncultured bacterium]|nr:MAG: Tyrosine-tRNA ligase [uncultured bacterium]
MSKSKPDSAIFMTDSFEDIKRKINRAWCPEGQIKENPILEYCRYILFEKFDALPIERPENPACRQTGFGGRIIVKSYQELEKFYAIKMIHPQDLKNTVVLLLDKLLQPVRQHFAVNKEAKKLLDLVKSYQITR